MTCYRTKEIPVGLDSTGIYLQHFGINSTLNPDLSLTLHLENNEVLHYHDLTAQGLQEQCFLHKMLLAYARPVCGLLLQQSDVPKNPAYTVLKEYFSDRMHYCDMQYGVDALSLRFALCDLIALYDVAQTRL